MPQSSVEVTEFLKIYGRRGVFMSYIENLEKQLFEMQDLKYRDFHSKLLPGIDRETIYRNPYTDAPGVQKNLQRHWKQNFF